MPPHKYTCYVTQARLCVMENRLLTRKIVLILMAHVFALATLLVALVPDDWQGLFTAVAIGSLLHVLWSAAVAWVLSRKIQRIQEDTRP